MYLAIGLFCLSVAPDGSYGFPSKETLPLAALLFISDRSSFKLTFA
jgi:hypothetical protein